MNIADRAKSEHSKNAIFVWSIYGVISLILGYIHGIVPFLIYFSVGIFLASFASIVTFLARGTLWKMASSGIGVLIFFILDVGWIVFIGYLFLRIINNLF